MGIQGLLPFLANSTRDAHISEFENEFVAIDAYCWLHKGIYSCAYELAMKKPTTKYVDYCMRYIEMLQHFQVKPILVFDGRHLSSKRETEKKRREERKKKYEKGKDLIRAGKTFEGRKLLGESVDISHEIALNLIKKCRDKNIDCIVAPYEADSQLAFLSLSNIVQCIITEDSDLLAYGCERVMFKMNTAGRGRLVEKCNIHFSLGMTPEDFSEENFRYMCILSGCDYLPSLPSIGPANALKFVKMLKDNSIYDALPRLPIYLNKMSVKVTPEYLEGFKIADNTFKHQLVYDPLRRLQVPLRPTDNDSEIIGTKLPDDVAFQLAIGNIDPISMTTLCNYNPDKEKKGFSFLWKDDQPKDESKLTTSKSHEEVTEGKKRQRETMESDPVQSVTNDLKKPRTPFCKANYSKPFAKKEVQTIPQTGFDFEPKVSGENKKVSKPRNSLLAKSRYFSKQKKKEPERKQTAKADGRQKGESYDDYVQRLYNECFLGEGDENDEPEGCCCVEQGRSKSLCSSCSKCRQCCGCSGKSPEVTNSQLLVKCINAVEEHENAKQKPTSLFLLEEIYESQTERSEEREVNGDDAQKAAENSAERSSSESLTSQFTKYLSKLDSRESPEGSKAELPEKENSEVVYVGEHKPLRSPSPVFRLHKDTRVLKRNCTLGNVSDTAGTPTSVYFSSIDPEILKESDSALMRTPSTFGRTVPSVRHFSSAPSKAGRSNAKGCSASRTLFQFGFKKERRSDPKS